MLQYFATEIVYSGSNTSYATFTCQMLPKRSETLPNIILFQWSRMDASQLHYTEIVHLGPKHKLHIFLCVEG
jgi:hypothetical protein